MLKFQKIGLNKNIEVIFSILKGPFYPYFIIHCCGGTNQLKKLKQVPRVIKNNSLHFLFKPFFLNIFLT